MTKANITLGRTQERGAQWQIVFRTHEGKDYCRETLPAVRTEADVREWAAAMCALHDLAGAIVERW
jgi:hypothetical protein